MPKSREEESEGEEPDKEHRDIVEDELKNEYFDEKKWNRFVEWKKGQKGWEQNWSRNSLYQAIQEFKSSFKYGRNFSKLGEKTKELYQYKMGEC